MVLKPVDAGSKNDKAIAAQIEAAEKKIDAILEEEWYTGSPPLAVIAPIITLIDEKMPMTSDLIIDRIKARYSAVGWKIEVRGGCWVFTVGSKAEMDVALLNEWNKRLETRLP